MPREFHVWDWELYKFKLFLYAYSRLTHLVNWCHYQQNRGSYDKMCTAL